MSSPNNWFPNPSTILSKGLKLKSSSNNKPPDPNILFPPNKFSFTVPARKSNPAEVSNWPSLKNEMLLLPTVVIWFAK